MQFCHPIACHRCLPSFVSFTWQRCLGKIAISQNHKR
jgi:hypothetical protein